jgi:hypothetical protein
VLLVSENNSAVDTARARARNDIDGVFTDQLSAVRSASLHDHELDAAVLLARG